MVSDLDGTLLHSRDYSFDEALPALQKLKDRRIPVVLVSSKTRLEVELVRESLGIEDPFVVENGGAAYVPVGYFGSVAASGHRSGRYEVLRWGVPYPELVEALREARRLTGAKLVGFSDATVEEVARRTGLTREAAERSMKREHDEPFWLEGEEDEPSRRALDILEKRGLSVTRGGRFYHVMGDCDKGKAVRNLLRLYRQSEGPVVTAGLGDARNDLPLLQSVDQGYLVARSDGRHDLAVREALPGIHCVGPAPGGWADAMEDFLARIDRLADDR